MPRRRIVCVVLQCDRCGRELGDDGECLGHYPEHAPWQLESAALDCGWTTDGSWRWHCDECPALRLAAEPVPVAAGQQDLAPDLGLDRLEVFLQRVGLVPWVP